MFIAAIFTITKTWNQPKCPSMIEWIKKMWDIYTMKYYEAIKKNETIHVFCSNMELDANIISEITQKQKVKYHIFSLVSGS